MKENILNLFYFGLISIFVFFVPSKKDYNFLNYLFTNITEDEITKFVSFFHHKYLKKSDYEKKKRILCAVNTYNENELKKEPIKYDITSTYTNSSANPIEFKKRFYDTLDYLKKTD